MSCPMGYGVTRMRIGSGESGSGPIGSARPSTHDEEEALAQNGVNKLAVAGGVSYTEYLHLDKLLDCQKLRSTQAGETVPDEHLFIVTHQAYELWFKQIIYDLDNVRLLLNTKIVDETKTLRIVNGLERTVRILGLLVDQMLILDTMSPLDFVEFRKYLTTASGFQSLQFRLLENKLGVSSEKRVRYNAQHYREVFKTAHEQKLLSDSETEPSLFKLIEAWLERTPGLHSHTNADGTQEDGFWRQYEYAVRRFLADMKSDAEASGPSVEARKLAMAEYAKNESSFLSIIDPTLHQMAVNNGERRLSHNAMKGALMIYFYRDLPRFSQPYQILCYLMDIDALLTKWRYNHVMLVQRQLGSKQGTGGSSGYLYLRTTVSDRYKVFLDLFNLSTWLIPRLYIPVLSHRLVKTLSEHSNLSSLDGTRSPTPVGSDAAVVSSQPSTD